MSQLINLILEFGLGLVFLNVLVEQAGLPVPAYPTLIVAGAYLAGDAQRDPGVARRPPSPLR